jgi:hypothetical protein
MDKDFGERFFRIREAKARADTRYLIDALRNPDHRSTAAGYLADLGAHEAIAPPPAPPRCDQSARSGGG